MLNLEKGGAICPEKQGALYSEKQGSVSREKEGSVSLNFPGSIQVAFTPIRIVCNNTLNAALRDSYNKLSIRHTKDAGQKLKSAHKVIGIVNLLSQELEECFNQMAKVRINDEGLKKFIEAALKPQKDQFSTEAAKVEVSKHFKNMVDDCFHYGMSHGTQQFESTKGTVFGAYNAVTGYFQNIKNYRSDSAKLINIIEGNSMESTQRAFNLAMKML